MDKKQRKKALIYIITALMVFNSFDKNEQKVMQQSSTEIQDEYDSYSNGRIFYCNSSEKAEVLCQCIDEKDIIVLDQLHFNDPNIKILSSHRIKDREEINEILCIVKNHFDIQESSWNRTVNSMENEWLIHNICYSLYIKRNNTNDVDLNNGDEERYKSKIINKILGN